jgi:hypothetical protein
LITASDFRHRAGPLRVETAIIEKADHFYMGHAK